MKEFLTPLLEAGISKEQAEQMQAFAMLLQEANQHTNLTRIVEPREMAQKHFLDSLAPVFLGLVEQGARTIDIGTGPGFPGVPLLIARPDIELVLVESVGKKAEFLERALEKLGLAARVCCGRAEELAREKQFRGAFHLGVSRAVASLPMLLELAAGFLAPGGNFLAYKGREYQEEVAAAENAWQQLGFDAPICHLAPLDGQEHVILSFLKGAETSEKYPRRFSKIKAKPL